ncbi:MAG TPA: Fe-S cluster assembly protein NifU [Elusimicrobiales bacterium]|jgi:NifU-like protein|nr:Fe-S cluster assembly protein NifU [Elusimicrobiales bacterium]HPO95388.1 Fe-S cluster assembly protein NifU [Elusimicrobiales bacterium]
MWNYTEKMMEYFKNPKNVGEIENPDAVGEVGSIVCGDALKLTLRIDEKTHKIIDAKFKTFGCASAIASSSVLTEMIKGKTLEEASKITNQDIADYLGGLPEQKMHCSVMGMEALEAAIENYYTKKGVKRIIGEQERVVCKCFNVTEKTILKAIELNNLKTVDEVTHFTKAGGGCGGCKGEIEKIIKDFWAGKEKIDFNSMTVVEKIKIVERILNEDINPKLKADGGFLELVDIEGNKIKVKFLGACSTCPSAGLTFKDVVQKDLKNKINGEIEVVLV